MIWFLPYVLARGWLWRLWGRWFGLTAFGGMPLYKVGILLLNLAPCVALYVTR